jgi:hypothetical protein
LGLSHLAFSPGVLDERWEVVEEEGEMKFTCAKCGKRDWILIEREGVQLCEWCAGVPLKAEFAQSFHHPVISDEDYLDSLPIGAEG